jgi:hypothetical protein
MEIPADARQLVGTILVAFGIVAALGIVGAVVLLVTAARQMVDLEIPPDADFFETLQMIPITVPIALDLLDLAFDVFSAPIAWVILELLGLQQLQMITVLESLIPATGPIPTMTIAWFVARGMKRKKGADTPFRSAMRNYELDSRGTMRRLGAGRASSALGRAGKYRGQELLASGGTGAVGDDIIDGDIIDEGVDDFDGDYAEDERV